MPPLSLKPTSSPLASSPPLAGSRAPTQHDETNARARDRDRDARDEGHPSSLVDPKEDLCSLDPMARSLWTIAPPELRVIEMAPPVRASPLVPAALDEILSRMVTRFALSGDKTRGTSHLVVGAGELKGGSVTLEAEGDAVHVRIDAPPGVDARAFGESIRGRLAAKGLRPTIELR